MNDVWLLLFVACIAACGTCLSLGAALGLLIALQIERRHIHRQREEIEADAFDRCRSSKSTRAH